MPGGWDTFNMSQHKKYKQEKTGRTAYSVWQVWAHKDRKLHLKMSLFHSNQQNSPTSLLKNKFWVLATVPTGVLLSI